MGDAVAGPAAEAQPLDRDAALAELHRSQYRALVRLTALLLDDIGQSEEIVQEAFVRVHRHWTGIADPPRYLRSTVLNLARSGMRRRRIALRRVEPPAVSADGPEDRALLAVERLGVLAAIRALPRRQRECIVLRYYLELSEAEIAATLGIAAGSVKSHTHRAMGALERALEDR